MELMQSRQNKQFEILAIPRKSLPQVGNRYRVYEDVTRFKLVEAGTAMEALKACGVVSAYKVVRDDPMSANLLGSGAWAVAATSDASAENNVIEEGGDILMAVGPVETAGDQPQA